ncbi:response regulator [Maridesulfovibrio sp.]|uniref:ATP-binding response regulator n=1 Tax=Maridesulfovibrio sp. TaxID=2795000 RepID=UPI0029CA2D35|nr:response regulator [Maridesulfovibrio sp.]
MSEGFEPEFFLNEFVLECREATELAVQDVLNLEEAHDQDSIDRIFRALHSIKGNSSMLGLTNLSKFVHKVEDACADIRSGQREIDKKGISVLLKSFDQIEAAFDSIVGEGHDKIDFGPGYKLFEESPDESAVEKTAPEKSAPTEPDDARVELRENPTALVVDDDFTSRKILTTFLSKYMPCYVAKDGVEAIQAVSESLAGNIPHFDVIMLDIMMPNIDGLQACKAIRQMERSKNMDTFGKESKIFIASSLNDDENIHKAVYECHADSYLIKPIMFETLQKLLVRFKLIAP